MTIETIDVWDFCPPFRDGPYAMSHVTSDNIYGRIFQFRGGDGRAGLGEVVFSPSLIETSREQRIRDEEDYLRPLLGQPFAALLEAASEALNRDKSWRGIAFALETAWFDWEGHRTNQSVSQLLGGSLQSGVADYFSISERTQADIQARVNLAGPQCRVFQLKLGMGSLEQDVAQVTTLLDIMSDTQLLQADANGGWTIDNACDIISRFNDHRLIWEEPCSTYDDNIIVAQRTGGHIMVDQCIGDREKAMRAIDEHIARSICIKPAPLGGLTVARQIRDRAAEREMRVRIDGPWCGDIASAAILHLAIGMPGDLLISGCDLREPVAIPVDLKGVCKDENHMIAPPAGAGLGIDLPGGLLGPPDRSLTTR